ncbi:hypothetical protein [Streptacidiphilus sp. P02-A3a]|uniref:hypothetical protein n=1 Tax=Streptacidiphilus sp. P02-A3a TaxID=2704468 RepID=UPI001CDC5E76|nr:hypothetical protein [Streptacidiphilus sp. P02-A3a]
MRRPTVAACTSWVTVWTAVRRAGGRDLEICLLCHLLAASSSPAGDPGDTSAGGSTRVDQDRSRTRRGIRPDRQGDRAHRADPQRWDAVDLDRFQGLYLPGGHRARGMRRYLESAFRRDLPVAAICHGVLLAARSTDPATGRSVLHGRRTTAPTWSLERPAWRVARRGRFWDRDYYRTYLEAPGQPEGYLSVQREVTRKRGAGAGCTPHHPRPGCLRQ